MKYILLDNNNQPIKNKHNKVMYKTLDNWLKWYRRNIKPIHKSFTEIGIFTSDKELEEIRQLPPYLRLGYCKDAIHYNKRFNK